MGAVQSSVLPIAIQSSASTTDKHQQIQSFPEYEWQQVDQQSMVALQQQPNINEITSNNIFSVMKDNKSNIFVEKHQISSSQLLLFDSSPSLLQKHNTTERVEQTDFKLRQLFLYKLRYFLFKSSLLPVVKIYQAKLTLQEQQRKKSSKIFILRSKVLKQRQNSKFKSEFGSESVFRSSQAQPQLSQITVYQQYIPFRLNDLGNSLCHNDGLFVLQQALIGFEQLYMYFSYFPVQSEMIGFNSQGQVRVWINREFHLNTFYGNNRQNQGVRGKIGESYYMQNMFNSKSEHNKHSSHITKIQKLQSLNIQHQYQMVRQIWACVQKRALFYGQFFKECQGFYRKTFCQAKKLILKHKQNQVRVYGLDNQTNKTSADRILEQNPKKIMKTKLLQDRNFFSNNFYRQQQQKINVHEDYSWSEEIDEKNQPRSQLQRIEEQNYAFQGFNKQRIKSYYLSNEQQSDHHHQQQQQDKRRLKENTRNGNKKDKRQYLLQQKPPTIRQLKRYNEDDYKDLVDLSSGVNPKQSISQQHNEYDCRQTPNPNPTRKQGVVSFVRRLITKNISKISNDKERQISQLQQISQRKRPLIFA